MEVITKNNKKVAVVDREEMVIKDVQSALDVLMDAKYNADTKNIVIDKNWC